VVIKKFGLPALWTLAACLLFAADAQSHSAEKVVYTDPKLEVFNVQIIGPNGVVGETSKAHRFIPRNEVFPNRKFLNPNDANSPNGIAPNISGGFFFDYEFPGNIDFSRQGDKKLVKSTDSLWGVAAATKDANVTIHQQLAAIYRKNLRCFPKGKLQFLNGCMLSLPTPEQAKAEDQNIGSQLNKQNGVALSEYTFALNSCLYGVCRQQVIVKENSSAKKDDAKEIANKLEFENKPAGRVEYYKPEKKSSSSATADDYIAPDATINLVDNTKKEEGSDDAGQYDSQPLPSSVDLHNSDLEKNVVAKGPSLSFSGKNQTVKATNKKGEVLSEVVQNYDEQIDRLKQKLQQDSRKNSGAGSAETNRELQALRAELAELKQIMRDNATRPIEIKQQESGSEIGFWGYLMIAVFLILAGIAGFSLFYKIMVLDKINESADLDSLDMPVKKHKKKKSKKKKVRKAAEDDYEDSEQESYSSDEDELELSGKKKKAAADETLEDSEDTDDDPASDDDDTGDSDEDLLLVNQLREDDTAEVIAEAKARIEDQKRKQEDVVRNQENIVETLVPDAGDNSNIASVDIFETEVVDQNFAEHTVEKIDIEKLDKD